MSIIVVCEKCGKKLTAPDELRGKRAKCSCGAVIDVPAGPLPEEAPAAEADAQSAPDRQQERPRIKAAVKRPSAAPGGRRASDRYTKGKSRGTPAMTYIGIGAGIAAVVALALAFLLPGNGATVPKEPPAEESVGNADDAGVRPVGGAAADDKQPPDDKSKANAGPTDQKPEDSPDKETADEPKGPPLKEEEPIEDFFDR